IAPFALVGMPDLHQELAVLRELQNLVVVIQSLLLAPAVPADPDVALVIYGDSVIRIRPVVAFSRAAPVADEVAGLVEFQNRRSGYAALCGGRTSGSVNLHRLISG